MSLQAEYEDAYRSALRERCVHRSGFRENWDICKKPLEVFENLHMAYRSEIRASRSSPARFPALIIPQSARFVNKQNKQKKRIRFYGFASISSQYTRPGSNSCSASSSLSIQSSPSSQKLAKSSHSSKGCFREQQPFCG